VKPALEGCVLALVHGCLLAGCTFHDGIRGSVHAYPETPGGAGAAMQGARVTLTCPEGQPMPVAETDATGRFAYRLDGPISNACWIGVDKPGMVPRKVRVLDVCADSNGAEDRCRDLVVTAHLARQPTP
jgi:hypothetical protein